MWVSVSQNVDTKGILNEMVESLTLARGDLCNTEGVIRKLEGYLKGKKFMLVLDDAWVDDREVWDGFKESLKRIRGHRESVILVTTRSNEVATSVGAVYQHLLKGLSDDESWTLFTQKASSSVTLLNVYGVDMIARRIMDKCKGIPLALKVMGGLLLSKQHMHEWKAIEESELWNLPQGRNQILPSLLLSFTNLHELQLQQCFTACAIFPKNWILEKCELVGLWSARGLVVSESRNLATMDICEEYIRILVNNSLFEEEIYECEICYRMHDLVHDLAVYTSGNDLLIKHKSDQRNIAEYQHVAILYAMHDPSYFPNEKIVWEPRTLILVYRLPTNLFSHGSYLHTLFLEKCGITEVPPAIGLLKHLRYLNLAGNPIKMLPDSIGKLYQLQSLGLKRCNSMTRLPKTLHKLVNLSHITTTSPMFASRGLLQLPHLQTLPQLSLDDDIQGWSIDELGGLQELRGELHIHKLEHVRNKEMARRSNLKDKSKVTELTLAWSEEIQGSDEVVLYQDVLEGLEPHPNIQSLIIQDFHGDNFPNWIAKMAVSSQNILLGSLTVVKLLSCKGCETLPTLGQLPLLKCLILNGVDVECIGYEFYGDDSLDMQSAKSFPSLRELEISGFEWLTTWMPPHRPTSGTVFPCLEILRVRDCDTLQSIPAMGIESLKALELDGLWSLQHLDILKYTTTLTSLVMNGLDEIKRLPEELANYTKLEELKIVGFPNLTSVPGGVGSLVSLRTLDVQDCYALICLPDDLFNGLSSLRQFRLIGCRNLTRLLPMSCVSLESLSIFGCPSVEPSPADIIQLINLTELHVGCKNGVHLRSIVMAIEHLPHLTNLGIEGYKDDEKMKEYFSDMSPFLRLPSLTILVLYGKPSIKTLPQQLGLLTRIKELCICDFPDLEEIPDWIHNLSSLEVLQLNKCIKLKRIPSKQVLQRLPQLYYLWINKCPMLVERYSKDNRGTESEWHNIQHLSAIEIDGKFIQDLPV